MKCTEIAVIGAGPAGLSAAKSASDMGAAVTLIDRNFKPGGQLVKQTHAFFGSEKEYASVRGIDIAGILCRDLAPGDRVELLLNATVLGYYQDDGILAVEQDEKFIKIKAARIIIATGAAERHLAFPNNDLPGVYGAGAVQTLMNEHKVMPGQKVLMVGAGNIGLIVSYQLLQAGVMVAAIIDAAPRIGGYLVHAAKVRRMGIPILVSHGIKMAHGRDCVEGATIRRLDTNWIPVPGTEKFLDVDVICIAVGLTPLAELLWQAGCRMRFVPELGGHVPLRAENLETTAPGIFVAGDVAGVEEASSAMVEGRLAGLCAAAGLGYKKPEFEVLYGEAQKQLASLRAGPVGAKTRAGLARLA